MNVAKRRQRMSERGVRVERACEIAVGIARFQRTTLMAMRAKNNSAASTHTRRVIALALDSLGYTRTEVGDVLYRDHSTVVHYLETASDYERSLGGTLATIVSRCDVGSRHAGNHRKTAFDQPESPAPSLARLAAPAHVGAPSRGGSAGHQPSGAELLHERRPIHPALDCAPGREDHEGQGAAGLLAQGEMPRDQPAMGLRPGHKLGEASS